LSYISRSGGAGLDGQSVPGSPSAFHGKVLVPFSDLADPDPIGVGCPATRDKEDRLHDPEFALR